MTIKIGRLFGIKLFIHWTFWLLPLWVIYNHALEPGADSLGLHLALLGALFGCVVLHEYGHALAARYFGIATRDVTLYPIGGVARLERMSERPWEEFCIAIAGPLVNAAIALVLGAGMLAFALVDLELLRGPLNEFLVPLLLMNAVLFGFNLLPAFPMDGGRILRALLSIPMGRLQATRVAVFVSFCMAVLFGIAGVLFLHNPWLLFVALFLIWTGQQELASLQMRERSRQADDEDAVIVTRDWRPSWPGTPREPVTIYVWDGRKQEWVAQGIVPSHGSSDQDRRAI
jgi:Zn-dependent protease